ncbi:MAG: tRNA (N6-isopentenyl adenosine(37)-C2)-methylthiotransferase MiaB [Chitinispirillaceae bacterium]|nr:tRNA (N6-isopentenyl adenosine(37)-C2)-methylthiotransferase MiaB [Chitinispirillaceae bacterium]
MPSVYFRTFGCQMNVSDSDTLRRALCLRGYVPVTTPGDADLIIVNTCSVREHAELRALARIAEFAAIKRRRKGARLWVVGCMAERLGEKLYRTVNGIDAVIGAQQLADAEAVVQAHLDDPGHGDAVHLAASVSEFVPVIRGCNNFCAYCVVPFVRGPERSVPVREIVTAIEKRMAAGVREVTLLGQNVNSYNDNGTDFADLLKRVAGIEGLQRVRFTTSHPKDCTDKLIRTIAETPRVCGHLHLPVQSASDRILRLMNRNYSVAHYRSLVAMARSAVPGIDITTDLLVGFPSEAEADFERTIELVREVRFTAAFMFAYSEREGTAAARLPDGVPRKEKLERLDRLIRIQTDITKAHYERMVGHSLEVMIYGPAKAKNGTFLKGQDRGSKRVLVACTGVKAGTILQVRVTRSSGMTLIAERI